MAIRTVAGKTARGSAGADRAQCGHGLNNLGVEMKLHKLARQARIWSAVVANVARAAYYLARGWKWWWEKVGEWLG
jgi:hypothetical protein